MKKQTIINNKNNNNNKYWGSTNTGEYLLYIIPVLDLHDRRTRNRGGRKIESIYGAVFLERVSWV